MIQNEILIDAIHSLSEGVSLYDAEGKFVLSNQNFIDFFDFSVTNEASENVIIDESATDDKTIDFILREGVDADQWSREFMGQAKNGDKKDFRILRADGHFFIGNVQKTGLAGYLLTIRDITEQRRAEQAEREADMLLHKIVESCPATFLVSRISDGKIIYCPPGSRARFGKIQSTMSFFLKPEDREVYLNALLPTGILDNFRVRFLRADGSIMDGLTSARVTDYKGEDVIVSSTRDITELLSIQAELELQRSIAHQNEKISALGGLLAGVAHELNNPLSIVLGYAYMLQSQVENPAVKRRVDRLAQAAERCEKIIKTFLAMARQRPTLIENCSINDVIDIALDITDHSVSAKGIKIEQGLGTKLPLIMVDQDQLAQVFTNLIINAEHALSAVGPDAVLTLRSYHDTVANAVIAEVEDNGIGISDDIKARIFEPFFTTKDVGEGTGVGLAFCDRIVSSHGGSITVTSELARGTCFKVSLPLSRGDEDDSAMPENTAIESKTMTKKILIVDDEKIVASMLSELLEWRGYEVITKNDATSALALLEMHSFDIILSDVKMPGTDGADFYDAICHQHASYKQRIGFITGDTLSPRVAEFFDRSDCPYIEKPVVPDLLYSLVDRLSQQSEKGVKND